MARVLLSNRLEGEYEYSFEPVKKGSSRVAVEKFLRKFGYIRRIRVNPLDRLVVVELRDRARKENIDPGELVRRVRSKCMNQCSAEETGLFTTSISEASQMIDEMITKAEECFTKCVDEVLKEV